MFFQEVILRKRRDWVEETGRGEKPKTEGFMDLKTRVHGVQPAGTSVELIECTQNCLPKRQKSIKHITDMPPTGHGLDHGV